MRLEGKTFLVTGGRSGLGAAVVAMLEYAGASAVVADLPECDVTDEAGVEALVAQSGDLHGVVCCAGIGGSARLLDFEAELFRRMAFNALISNTDDHLRNHGFLRTSTAGWSLSPAFDLNPNPETGPKRLSTAIGYGDAAARVDLLMEVAEYFRLGEDDAGVVLEEVDAATSQWKAEAARRGLGGAAVEDMASAFEHEQAEAARELVA